MRFFLFASLLLLAACSPQSQPYKPLPPEQAKLETQHFYQADGAMLPYRVWTPEKSSKHQNPKAVIIALHGFNDYSQAFEGVGKFFSQHGVVVYAYDQRGFGAAPKAGIWPGEQNLTNDLANFVRRVSERYPQSPVYILGESMGGAVTIVALAQPDFPTVQGVILVAPAVWGEDTMNPFYRFTLWLTAHLIPSYELTGSDLKILASNNIPMLQRMANDPLVIKSTRVDSVYGIVKLMDRAYDLVPEVDVPVLMLYGSEDQVIPPQPIQHALLRFSHPVRYLYYTGSYHMMLRDIQGQTIMADILGWITHDSPASPARKMAKLTANPQNIKDNKN